MKNFLLIISTLLITACGTQKQMVKSSNPKLEFLWETDTLLTTVESVIYDAKTKFIYSSNIEGSPGKKDGIGSISKIDINGKIIKRDWISGLNAPKGMDIYKGKLFVTDIDRLIEIDINKGEITKTYSVDGAVFLNDVAAAPDGKIYFSDTDISKIFYLENGKVNTLLSFDSPNGLLVRKNKLLAVSWVKKTFSSIDLKTKQIESIAADITDPDGIEAIDKNSYLISSWNGMIHHVTKDGQKKVLLDTKDNKVFSADIDYISSKKILLVPTFFTNKVVAYRYSE